MITINDIREGSIIACKVNSHVIWVNDKRTFTDKETMWATFLVRGIYNRNSYIAEMVVNTYGAFDNDPECEPSITDRWDAILLEY